MEMEMEMERSAGGPTAAEREWFREGVGIGLRAALVIAERHGATAVHRDELRRRIEQLQSRTTRAGEAEYKSWLMELEMQSWGRARD